MANKFIKRFSFAYRFARNKDIKHMQAMTCAYCGSFNISKIKSEIDNAGHSITETSYWQCERCGSMCREEEYWCEEKYLKS